LAHCPNIKARLTQLRDHNWRKSTLSIMDGRFPCRQGRSKELGGAAIRPEDDPFWAAAQANGVAVHFHVRVMRALAKPKPKGARGDDLVGLASVGAANMIIDMGEIIQSGVHDRFPKLTWVMVEAGSGWIPYILEQLDDRWHRNRSWLPVKLEHEPSYYYRRNWRSTFMVDRYAIENRHHMGVENLMFSTDYPHHGCDWPYSRKVINELFAEVGQEDRRRILAMNAAELYHLV
jgi:predicted TIM-barrel fold metal-dependent hydrolase